MKEVSRRGRRKRWSQVKRWKDESGQRRMSLLLMTRSREVTLGKLSDGVRECRAGKNPSVSAMFSVRAGSSAEAEMGSKTRREDLEELQWVAQGGPRGRPENTGPAG